MIFLLQYCFSLIALVTPLIALFCLRKSREKMLKLYLLYYTILFALTLLIYSVSPASSSSWRLCALYGTAVLATVLISVYLLKQKKGKIYGIMILACVLLCVISNMYQIKQIPSVPNKYDQVTELLKANDLKKGYSTFWNSANVVTVLSDSEVMVSPIDFDIYGAYYIDHYQSEPQWYKAEEGIEQYFIVLNAEEKELYTYLSDTCTQEIKYDDNLYILVFNDNLFDDAGNPVFSP